MVDKSKNIVYYSCNLVGERKTQGKNKMKVKCTNVMAREIMAQMGKDNRFSGYIVKCQRGTDFWGFEKKVITIYYPANYYAIPRDLDDYDLLRIFKKSDRTYNGFFADLLDDIEI